MKRSFPQVYETLCVGDYQYQGKPSGRILVVGSPWIINWLGEKERQGLVTVTRLVYITVIPIVTDTVFPKAQDRCHLQSDSRELPAATHCER